MNLLLFLKTFLRGPKIYLSYLLRFQKVLYHNPDAYLSFPIAFDYDDVTAIQIGPKVVIAPFSEIIVWKRSPYSAVEGRLEIGDRAVVGSNANIRAGGGEIIIGCNTIIAQQVSLIASNHKISPELPYRDLPWDETKTGIVIGENVWIGAGATILPGCVIGNNSIVGAGSVVTKSIPANEVWAGVPARKLRDVSEVRHPDTQDLDRNGLKEISSDRVIHEGSIT